MGERILFEYRANEAGDHDCANHSPRRRAWGAHGPAFRSCCDWRATGMMASPGMKPGAMNDTLAFFEDLYRDLFGGEESENH